MSTFSSSRAAQAAAIVLLGSACTGPQTFVDNPDGHRVFVDGEAIDEKPLPFRYYGESRWDALPADEKPQRPDWSLQPASGAIALPPPASLWLFPFDLPIQLLRRVVLGREDVTAHVVLPPTPPGERVESEVAPTGEVQLVERAVRARLAR